MSAPVSVRPYRADPDFLSIRQFLIDTFALYGRPYNWLIDRWNFCRYFAVPVHTFYNVRYFGVPTMTHPSIRDEVPSWESTVSVWETAGREIVGVVMSANEEPGEVWIQIHPDFTHLYAGMVDHAEQTLADWVGGVGYVKLYVNDGGELERIAAGRGYRRLQWFSIQEYRLTGDEAAPALPDGFVIKSVAEEDDVEQRRIAKAIAFGNHFAPQAGRRLRLSGRCSGRRTTGPTLTCS
jgi:hypothetical protein